MSPTQIPDDLMERAGKGDPAAISELFDLFRGRLKKMVATRLNPQIRRRVDESDILQDAFLEASKRLPEYLADPQAPFFLWLRTITGYRIIDAHRTHLGAAARSVGNEITLGRGRIPMTTSVQLAEQLLGNVTSPSQAYVKEETRQRLLEAINGMDAMDREILALRQFEELSNRETAEELGIEPAAASKRFVRALQRLHTVLIELNLAPNQSAQPDD